MNATDTMLPSDMQLSNEYRFSRKHIDGYIAMEIRDSPEMERKVLEGVTRIDDYMQTTYSYKSKNTRIAQLKGLDIEQLVREIFVQVAYCQVAELFTSVTAQLAGKLKFSERVDGILTIAELMAVLCQTDAFDICKADRSASLVVQSRIPLSERLIEYVRQSRYLPPMVCEPSPLHSNFDSGYLTHNDCLVLGKANSHSGDICLDVLNTQNRVALQLDVDLLTRLSEAPKHALDTLEKQQQWEAFVGQSYAMYDLLVHQGNRFWLTHKPDKRGRIYAQGYHVSTQASAFKKAIVELADEEIVEGAP